MSHSTGFRTSIDILLPGLLIIFYDAVIGREQDSTGRFCTCNVQCIRRIDLHPYKFMISSGNGFRGVMGVTPPPAKSGATPSLFRAGFWCDFTRGNLVADGVGMVRGVGQCNFILQGKGILEMVVEQSLSLC